MANKPSDYRENLPWYSEEISVMFDSLENIFGPMDYHNFHFVQDADEFTEESLIEYINQAFEAWNNPWSKKVVSFTDFCNYVLPYRNFSEPLESWREMFIKKFNWIYDSVSKDEDIITVARLLNHDSELKYSNGFNRYIVSIAPSLILKAMYGTCPDNSNYKAMIMRAYGIPATIDFIPQYGSDHNLHYWNSVMDHNGNFISFEEALNDINAHVAYKYKIGKVYRKTFTTNKEIKKLLDDTKGDVPPAFRDPRFIDVTSQYVAVSDIKLQLKNIPKGTKYVYVAVFNDHSWSPISCASIINGKYTVFTDLGREVMYLPVYFAKGQVIPAGLPFTVSERGYIQYMESKDKKVNITLTRKYHFEKRKSNWLRCLEGGIFEGANKADFSDADIIGRIKQIPGEHFEELNSSSKDGFQYLRFCFSPDEKQLPYDGDGASIAEIEFINKYGKVIHGTPVGSPGRKYNSYTAENCFDGNPLTFFEDARYGITPKYVGLRLNHSEQVSVIRYIARNDMNSIQPGDEYELFYWNNIKFKSLGKVISKDTLIKFDHVPQDALLWLRDLSEGKEERIFTWKDGKQVWW